jgi:hypothetical protein
MRALGSLGRGAGALRSERDYGAFAAATAAGGGGQPSASAPYRKSGSAGPKKRYCKYADRSTRISLKAGLSSGLFERTAQGRYDDNMSSYHVKP